MVSVQSAEFSDKVESYRDLIAWQKTVVLIKAVYQATQPFPRDEVWGLTSQIKRAAVSVSANIAEGSSKRSTREFIRFLNISYGSLAELEAHLIVATELGFMTSNELARIESLSKEVGKILNGLIRSLETKLNSEL